MAQERIKIKLNGGEFNKIKWSDKYRVKVIMQILEEQQI